MLRNFVRGFRRAPRKSALELVLHQRDRLASLSDEQLKAAENGFAKTAVAAERVLGLRPHDEQILGAHGDGRRGHCRNANRGREDAGRRVGGCGDGPRGTGARSYGQRLSRPPRRGVDGRRLPNFSVCPIGFITHDLPPDDRRRAYRCHVTYATANEVGFDFLRDQLVLRPGRPGAARVRHGADR